MRALVSATLLAGSLLGCGDSNDADEVFPDAEGVYEVTGGFDGLSASEANFTGTLTLTQATRSSGALAGDAAFLVTINGELFNVTDNIESATVSPTGVVNYSLVEGAGSWTFTVTLSNNALRNGRHTLSDGSSSFSGAWSATRAPAVNSVARLDGRGIALDALARRLSR